MTTTSCTRPSFVCVNANMESSSFADDTSVRTNTAGGGNRSDRPKNTTGTAMLDIQPPSTSISTCTESAISMSSKAVIFAGGINGVGICRPGQGEKLIATATLCSQQSIEAGKQPNNSARENIVPIVIMRGSNQAQATESASMMTLATESSNVFSQHAQSTSNMPS